MNQTVEQHFPVKAIGRALCGHRERPHEDLSQQLTRAGHRTTGQPLPPLLEKASHAAPLQMTKEGADRARVFEAQRFERVVEQLRRRARLRDLGDFEAQIDGIDDAVERLEQLQVSQVAFFNMAITILIPLFEQRAELAVAGRLVMLVSFSGRTGRMPSPPWTSEG